jgi:hypothetical protein
VKVVRGEAPDVDEGFRKESRPWNLGDVALFRYKVTNVLKKKKRPESERSANTSGAGGVYRHTHGPSVTQIVGDSFVKSPCR